MVAESRCAGDRIVGVEAIGDAIARPRRMSYEVGRDAWRLEGASAEVWLDSRGRVLDARLIPAAVTFAPSDTGRVAALLR